MLHAVQSKTWNVCWVADRVAVRLRSPPCRWRSGRPRRRVGRRGEKIEENALLKLLVLRRKRHAPSQCLPSSRGVFARKARAGAGVHGAMNRGRQDSDLTHPTHPTFVGWMSACCPPWFEVSTEPSSAASTPQATHHTPHTTHHTPHTTHRTPRTTHHTPHTAHHKPQTTNHTPDTTHHTTWHTTPRRTLHNARHTSPHAPQRHAQHHTLHGARTHRAMGLHGLAQRWAVLQPLRELLHGVEQPPALGQLRGVLGRGADWWFGGVAHAAPRPLQTSSYTQRPTQTRAHIVTYPHSPRHANAMKPTHPI